MQLKTIVSTQSVDIAFIVGNGINRYPNNPKVISWDDLLIELWNKFSSTKISEVPKGISATEFYDLLDIESSNGKATNLEIQKEACRLLESWSDKPHHKLFIEKARSINAPVLTTNFDLILPTALDLRQFHLDKRTFTDYYPWTTYYGDQELIYPTDNFGIWYINGFIKYHRSIKLGLSHYMGSVEKARSYLHKGNEGNLFSGKDQNNWRGCNTWLHIIFNKPLCIFGLGLEENEVFLRWLLIERAKYFHKFPERKKKGWYVVNKPDRTDDKYKGKKYFFEHIGFEVIEADDYDSIYKTPWE